MNAIKQAVMQSVKRGGGKPAPQDTVPASIVPGAASTMSRVVEQPPPGSKPALLAPGEIVHDQDSSQVIARMIDEFKRTGKVDGKKPTQSIKQIIQALQAHNQEEQAEGEPGFMGGGMAGYFQGGVADIGNARDAIADAGSGAFPGQPASPPSSITGGVDYGKPPNRNPSPQAIDFGMHPTGTAPTPTTIPQGHQYEQGAAWQGKPSLTTAHPPTTPDTGWGSPSMGYADGGLVQRIRDAFTPANVVQTRRENEQMKAGTYTGQPVPVAKTPSSGQDYNPAPVDNPAMGNAFNQAGILGVIRQRNAMPAGYAQGGIVQSIKDAFTPANVIATRKDNEAMAEGTYTGQPSNPAPQNLMAPAPEAGQTLGRAYNQLKNRGEQINEQVNNAVGYMGGGVVGYANGGIIDTSDDNERERLLDEVNSPLKPLNYAPGVLPRQPMAANQKPGGIIGSGNAAIDQAITKAMPRPMPEEPATFGSSQAAGGTSQPGESKAPSNVQLMKPQQFAAPINTQSIRRPSNWEMEVANTNAQRGSPLQLAQLNRKQKIADAMELAQMGQNAEAQRAALGANAGLEQAYMGGQAGLGAAEIGKQAHVAQAQAIKESHLGAAKIQAEAKNTGAAMTQQQAEHVQRINGMKPGSPEQDAEIKRYQSLYGVTGADEGSPFTFNLAADPTEKPGLLPNGKPDPLWTPKIRLWASNKRTGQSHMVEPETQNPGLDPSQITPAQIKAVADKHHGGDVNAVLATLKARGIDVSKIPQQ